MLKSETNRIRIVIDEFLVGQSSNSKSLIERFEPNSEQYQSLRNKLTSFEARYKFPPTDWD